MKRDSPAVDLSPAIHAADLTKRYGDVLAVDHLDLDVRAGEFFGLLGPNGSGKTSTIHMLSTLIRPTGGTARIAGHDVSNEGVKVRAAIGVVFQESALDRNLSAAENLRFAGLLYDLPRAEIKRRSDELLALFGLTDKRDKPVASFSGGMRRALDIARGVIHRPRVLFLDEPTIGLDLPNRKKIWRFIENLRAETGMTVFLTTHYLEEAADCDRVAFIKSGHIVQSGPPHELVSRLGAFVIEIEADDADRIVAELAPRLGRAMMDGERACFRFHGDATQLAALQTEFADRIGALRWRKPNLNDVFLWVNETEAAGRPSSGEMEGEPKAGRPCEDGISGAANTTGFPPSRE
ncbi:MAG: ABC transporter ATP-binding protein [Burkholderiales bacterium]|nr:ATP-binding cassette domain-containing protein [Burkholderiales bacterium]